MLIPSKHEDLRKNILVIGADILALLKKKHYNIEALFQQLKTEKSLNLDQYYNVITFLYVAELIESHDFYILPKK